MQSETESKPGQTTHAGGASISGVVKTPKYLIMLAAQKIVALLEKSAFYARRPDTHTGIRQLLDLNNLLEFAKMELASPRPVSEVTKALLGDYKLKTPEDVTPADIEKIERLLTGILACCRDKVFV